LPEWAALGQLRTSTAVQQKSPFALTSPLVDAVALVGSYLAAGNVFGPSLACVGSGGVVGSMLGMAPPPDQQQFVAHGQHCVESTPATKSTSSKIPVND
jgi:hypothetical protein